MHIRLKMTGQTVSDDDLKTVGKNVNDEIEMKNLTLEELSSCWKLQDILNGMTVEALPLPHCGN